VVEKYLVEREKITGEMIVNNEERITDRASYRKGTLCGGVLVSREVSDSPDSWDGSFAE